MQFKIGSSSAAREAESVSLLFEIAEDRLIAVGEAQPPFDAIVQSFDPNRDIFYRAPERLTPEELAEEVDIHLPESLRQTLNSRVVPGMLDGLMLMQHIPSACPAIPPLAALEKMLRATGSVNSAILHADNGGILFVRNAGTELHAGASAHSLKAFLSLSEEEREHVLPDFHASEFLLSGYDLDHFQNFDLGQLSTSRRIAISDFTGLCEFTSEAATLVEMNPHLYTLAIGAAAIYAEIFNESET
jgi:hypothetical protein